jgi:hypothetical protein
MPYKPELHDAEGVLSYYDQYDEAAYSVYAGHKIDETCRRFSYDGDDKITGRQHLSDALASVMSNPDNTNTYLLVILRDKGKKKEAHNTITFQLNRSNYGLMQQQVGMYNPQMQNEITALKSQIAALQMQLEEEDEEEEEEPENNLLSGLMGNPAVRQMLMNVVANLVTPQQQQKVTHVSGVEADSNDEKIANAIERLKKCDEQLGDDLLLLCEMAENDKMQFNFLLKMLRK